MNDHVLVVTRVPRDQAVDDGTTVFGPASRGEIVAHLRQIGANQAVGDFTWFDNVTPGVTYRVLQLIAVPTLTPV